MFRSGRAPWWFSSDGSGRFDLSPPYGTCYFADEPLAGLLEVARGLTLLSEEFLASRRLFTVRLPRALRLADITAAAAYAYGITGELSATTDYTDPQAWARSLHCAGFDGINYRIRHDPRGDLTGIAWFGSAGVPDNPPSGEQSSIPASVLLGAAPFGIRIAADL